MHTMYKFYCSMGCENDGEIYMNSDPVFCPSCGIKFEMNDVLNDENWNNNSEYWNDHDHHDGGDDEEEPWNK